MVEDGRFQQSHQQKVHFSLNISTIKINKLWLKLKYGDTLLIPTFNCSHKTAPTFVVTHTESCSKTIGQTDHRLLEEEANIEGIKTKCLGQY